MHTYIVQACRLPDYWLNIDGIERIERNHWNTFRIQFVDIFVQLTFTELSKLRYIWCWLSPLIVLKNEVGRRWWTPRVCFNAGAKYGKRVQTVFFIIVLLNPKLSHVVLIGKSASLSACKIYRSLIYHTKEEIFRWPGIPQDIFLFPQ